MRSFWLMSLVSCLFMFLQLGACGEDASSGPIPAADASDPSPNPGEVADAGTTDTVSDEADACWWCTDADPSAAPETLEGADTGKGGGGKGDGSTAKAYWMGNLDTETCVGQLSYLATEGGAEICRLTYELVDGVVLDLLCEDCSVGCDVTVGALTESSNETKCQAGVGAEGEAYIIANSPVESYPGFQTLMRQVDDAWVAYGFSELTGTAWTFYPSGDAGGKDEGGGKDDAGNGKD